MTLSPRGAVALCMALHAVLFLWVFKLPGLYYTIGSDTQHVYWPAVRKLLAGHIPYLDPHFFVEYPPLGTAVFLLPALLHPTTLRAYDWLFAAEMLLVDAAALALVALVARRLATSVVGAVLAYGAMVPLLGAVVCQRYDLVPAALVLGALLALLHGRSATAWLLLLAATLTKVYPLVLAPLFLLYEWRRGRRAGALLYAGGLIASGAAWLMLAPASLHRFLAWETQRGIEIESLPGSLVALLHRVGLPVHMVPPSAYGSWDVASALTPTLETLTTALTVALLAAVYAWFARRDGGDHALVIASALAVLGLLLGSKLLSIQFLLWLLPLVAVQPRRRVAAVALSLGAVALSQYIFPFYWHDLRTLQPTLVSYLALRNLLLLALFLLLWRGRDSPAGMPVARRVDSAPG